jgi:GNAT superfamily N-acetyltransferase
MLQQIRAAAQKSIISDGIEHPVWKGEARHAIKAFDAISFPNLSKRANLLPDSTLTLIFQVSRDELTGLAVYASIEGVSELISFGIMPEVRGKGFGSKLFEVSALSSAVIASPKKQRYRPLWK